MKKILFLSLMGMTLAACSNEDLPFEDTTQPTSKVLWYKCMVFCS